MLPLSKSVRALPRDRAGRLFDRLANAPVARCSIRYCIKLLQASGGFPHRRTLQANLSLDTEFLAMIRQEVGVRLSTQEGIMLQELEMERYCRRNTLDLVFAQRAFAPRNCLLTRWRPDNQLRQQRVVMWRHVVANEQM